MSDSLKRIGDILAEIVHKLGEADKAVLEPYVKQMNAVLDSMKKSGHANIQDNLVKLSAIIDKIKDAKIGDLPGFSAGIGLIQSTLKSMMGKEGKE